MVKKSIFNILLLLSSIYAGSGQQIVVINMDQQPQLFINGSGSYIVKTGDVVNLDTVLYTDSKNLTEKQWKIRDGSFLTALESPTITVNRNLTVYLNITSEFGCSANDSAVIYISGTNVNTIVENSFQLFPNPSSGAFEIHFSDCKNGFSYQLVNVLGEVLLDEDIDCTESENVLYVNHPEISSGMYFFLIQHNGIIVYQNKIIVSK